MTIDWCGEFEDFRADQGKRWDPEVTVEPEELYLGVTLTDCMWEREPFQR